MRCYACERQDVSTCPRCGKTFCPDHGANLCAECLDPVAAAPSPLVFRAALFGLLGASVLALWLLVRPPGLPGDNGGVVQQPDTTPAFTPALTPDTGETPTPTLTGTPAASPDGSPEPTEGVTPTPEPTATPEPTPEPTPAPIEYVVESGDSWNTIAAEFGVDATVLAEFNGYSITDVLPLGITLIIPQ